MVEFASILDPLKAPVMIFPVVIMDFSFLTFLIPPIALICLEIIFSAVCADDQLTVNTKREKSKIILCEAMPR